MSLPPLHRVVTGHDTRGKAVVTSDGPLPTVVELDAAAGSVFHEVWSTATFPVVIDNGPDPTTGPLTLAPAPHGTRIRFIDFPPESEETLDPSRAKGIFAEMGGEDASTVGTDAPHPLMHRTETLDYGVVIEGEITLVLDDSEVPLAPGSVVVQRGTNHAWANRSGRPCRMLFVLLDGQYEASNAPAPTQA